MLGAVALYHQLVCRLWQTKYVRGEDKAARYSIMTGQLLFGSKEYGIVSPSSVFEPAAVLPTFAFVLYFSLGRLVCKSKLVFYYRVFVNLAHN